MDPRGNEWHPTVTKGEDGLWRTRPRKSEGEHIFRRKRKKGGIHPGKIGRRQPWKVRGVIEKGGTMRVREWSAFTDLGTTTEATANVTEITGEKAWDAPIPDSLISRIVEMATGKDLAVLDFLSASAATAHAVLKSNIRDLCNRRLVLVEKED